MWLFVFKLNYRVRPSKQFCLMLQEPNITREMLGQITIPVTILAGSRDMIRQDHMKEIAMRIEHCDFQVLPGETHSSYVVNSDKIAYLIRDTFTLE